jgi:urease accessory protein UreE
MPRFDSKSEREQTKVTEISINRGEAMRGRLRAKASDGEEVIIELPRGAGVNDGDVFGPSINGTYYRARIEPEKVLRVELQEGASTVENALKLGYELGGHHLEIMVEGGEVFVPLSLPPDKIDHILNQTQLPVKTEIVTRVISPDASGYFAGEDHE